LQRTRKNGAPLKAALAITEKVMAKKTSSPPLTGPPQVSPGQGIELLTRQIAAAEALMSARPIPRDQYSSWELVTRNLLEKAFGVNSPNVSSITDVGKYGSFPMEADERWWDEHRHRSLTTQVSKLRGLVELLKTEVQLQDTGVPKAGSEASPTGHRIFLVHGHDKLRCMRLLASWRSSSRTFSSFASSQTKAGRLSRSSRTTATWASPSCC
jgi:hypothetical protein